MVLIAVTLFKPLRAQEISLDVSDVTLEEALSRLNQRYGYHFVYVASALQDLPHVSVSVSGRNIHVIMNALLRNLPLTYAVRDRVVTLVRKQDEDRFHMSTKPITGEVYDTETTKAIPNVGIQWVGREGGGTSGSSEGIFDLNVPIEIDSLRFTAVGYHPHTEALVGSKRYRIGLRPLVVDIEEVVVTGIVERNVGSYTSATTTISGTQLRQLTNTDVIAALEVLDPAFVVIANNLRGSDPAVLPQIELRGKTSLSGLSLEGELGIDPNLPLFILDGFESSLEQIVALDINRIESVTLLKDAASSALYGARSANGVVVVETRKLATGKPMLYYRADIGVETADIGGYNMMNSLEKVAFEHLAGRYTPQGNNENPAALSRVYNDRRKKALQGQDFNWLEVPLRPGFTHNHSLFIQGGNNRWQYAVGGNRRNRQGVMQGSDHTTWGAWADVAFRKEKWSVLGKSFVNEYTNTNLPANDFSRYVKQSPLYTPLDTAKYLDEIPYRDQQGFYSEPNYVYDAQLNSAVHTRTHAYQQNVAMVYTLSPSWELSSRWQLGYQQTLGSEFWSPKDTRYEKTPIQQRGSYAYRQSRRLTYQGNVMATWNRMIADRHGFTLNLRAEIQQNDLNYRGYTLVGFPLETSGNPHEAYADVPDQPGPLPSPPMIRRLNGLVSGNYMFAKRFFMDVTGRIDGSTQFGSANRYAAFWSVGVGWNVHDEPFLKNSGFVDVLRIRLNTGLTGNQSFGSFLSTVVYEQASQTDGGITHDSFGNPYLKWQSTRQTNIGLDVELWGGRLVLSGNWYRKNTDPLIGVIDMPPSTGVSNFAMNVGALKTHGVDAFVRFSPIFHPKRNVLWSVGATFFQHRSRYANLAAELVALNEQMRNNRALSQYVNGYSPDDLWAVRSLGIEPTTGREMFFTKEGLRTFEYNPADAMVVGNARPWGDGIVSTIVHYKGFSFGAYFRYTLGRALLNEALYEKVENIDFEGLSANQDRRALYDRWQHPGDRTRFRGISLLEETPMSSRFIQRENLFSGESLSIGYAFLAAGSRLLQPLHVRQIRLTGYAHDFLRLSNVLVERGTQYPFSKTFSFSLEVTW